MSRSAGVPCRSFVSFLNAYWTEIGRFIRNWPCIASIAASDDSKLSKLTKPNPLEMPARQHSLFPPLSDKLRARRQAKKMPSYHRTCLTDVLVRVSTQTINRKQSALCFKQEVSILYPRFLRCTQIVGISAHKLLSTQTKSNNSLGCITVNGYTSKTLVATHLCPDPA
jgi:hypothetical protein